MVWGNSRLKQSRVIRCAVFLVLPVFGYIYNPTAVNSKMKRAFLMCFRPKLFQTRRHSIQKKIVLQSQASLLSTCMHRTRVLLLGRRQYPTHFLQQRSVHDEREVATTDAIRLMTASDIKNSFNLFKCIYINLFYDSSFRRTDFIEGAKRAMCYVSNWIGIGKPEVLKDVISEDALLTAVNAVKNVSANKRKWLLFNVKHIFYIGITDFQVLKNEDKR